MKTRKILILIYVLLCVASLDSIYAQIRSDFVLVEKGAAPSLKVDKNGNIQVIWLHEGIYHGVFDSLLNEIKASKRISSSGQAYSPRLDVKKEYAMVVWEVSQPTIFNSLIGGQLLTVSGDTVSGNVEFNDSFGDADRFAPDVAFLTDTTFIVVWSGNGPGTGSSTGIYGQIATVSHKKIGSNILLSDVFGSEILHGASLVVSDSSSGDFIVVWRDDRFGSNKAFGRLFFSDGRPKDASFLMSEDPELTDLWFLSGAMAPAGNFAVVWGSKKDNRWHIQLRWFLDDGMPLGPSLQVNSGLDTIVAFPSVDLSFDFDGTFVVVWEQEEGGHSKIFAQRFLPDGTLLGGNFRVSLIENTSDQFFPNVLLYNGKIYTAWVSQGIWANILDFNNLPTSVETQATDFPKNFQLHQNYPNPFNPTTTIKYEVSQRSRVSLVIYNVLGEEITTLVNKEVMPGIHEVQWNGKDLKGGEVSTGIYFYRLSADGRFTKIRKMLLVR
ncbi:MAG: T9SS type A sorting domain-containing protein [bacterium]